ncbi:hypothetical protein [Georgenia sp. SUBG003]|uniref:hypothetical protein n=1 Tax=Georgenia sp. SUBG003 TaxID=1497974 RepID=UPI0004D7D972|nr:hypothetical protein DA06_08170 [Georgenia sp. SUBG003]
MTYDLHRPACLYQGLLERLSQFPASCQGLDSSCFVVSDGSADDVRDELTPHLHPGDGLLVTALTPDVASWTGLRPEARRWIHTHIS